MEEITVKKLIVHQDKRGFLYEIFRPEDVGTEFGQTSLTVAKPGLAKGNHYHKKTKEWYCVIKGKMKLVMKDVKTGEKQEMMFTDEEPCIIAIPPWVSHGFKNMGEDTLYVLIYTDRQYNHEEPDVYPDVIIE